MTPHEYEELLDGIADAVKNHIAPVRGEESRPSKRRSASRRP